jgi:hypothetical protein
MDHSYTTETSKSELGAREFLLPLLPIKGGQLFVLLQSEHAKIAFGKALVLPFHKEGTHIFVDVALESRETTRKGQTIAPRPIAPDQRGGISNTEEHHRKGQNRSERTGSSSYPHPNSMARIRVRSTSLSDTAAIGPSATSDPSESCKNYHTQSFLVAHDPYQSAADNSNKTPRLISQE